MEKENPSSKPHNNTGYALNPTKGFTYEFTCYIECLLDETFSKM